MKKYSYRLRAVGLLAVAVSLTSCWTRIYTVAPTAEPVAPVKTVYTTQVTTPTPKVTTTTTVTVTSFNSDISFYLDLTAVAAAFAEARNIQEFEQLLNSPRYMINNLDLNHDGWIDYLRVIETYQGYYHALLVQACLAPGVFQDVATLVAERRANTLMVEVIGNRYLYGPNYIVRPTFVKRPPMWDYYGRPSYSPWVSPYYYDYYPSYYTHPKPIYLSHYQAYVNTYITNNHYCNHCDYPSQPFYNGYAQMTQTHVRNDYERAHPNDSFEQRVTNNLTQSGSGVRVRNAGELRTETQRQARAAAADSSTSSSSRQSSSSTTSSGSGVSSRQSGTTSSSSTTTTTTSGSSQRQSGTTQTQQTQQRQPASTQTQQRQPAASTSVETRVNKSGTTRTTIKTTDASGRTTTTKRESATKREAAPARSSQSSGSSTRSTSGSTSTRSSGSSSSTTSSGSGTRTRR